MINKGEYNGARLPYLPPDSFSDLIKHRNADVAEFCHADPLEEIATGLLAGFRKTLQGGKMEKDVDLGIMSRGEEFQGKEWKREKEEVERGGKIKGWENKQIRNKGSGREKDGEEKEKMQHALTQIRIPWIFLWDSYVIFVNSFVRG